jgi:hypothetical protein
MGYPREMDPELGGGAVGGSCFSWAAVRVAEEVVLHVLI